MPFEVTTFRVDGEYKDSRHPESVNFVRDVKADLARRDFTVNALMEDVLTGEIIDSFGGLETLKSYDGGKTWTEPEMILDETGGAPPHLIMLSSGLIVSTYGRRKQPYGIMAMISFDNGRITDIAKNAFLGTKYGTNYTSAALLSSYLPEFTKYFVSVVKTVAEFMRIRSIKYHVPFTKTVNGVSYSILRHTPRERMRMLIYAPLMIEAEANVSDYL